jgi:hypothetical protein
MSNNIGNSNFNFPNDQRDSPFANISLSSNLDVTTLSGNSHESINSGDRGNSNVTLLGSQTANGRQITPHSRAYRARLARHRELENVTISLAQATIASPSNSNVARRADRAASSAAPNRPDHEQDGEHFRRQPLTLAQLSFGEEQPDQLIDLPGLSHQALTQVRAPRDSATSALTGRAYLKHLMRDDLRLPPALKLLIKGKHILRTGSP